MSSRIANRRVSHRPSARHLSHGLSLIEVMVSLVIGLFLVIGATTVYVNSRRTADVDDSVARLQETARYAMSVVETDVRMANYWGLAKNSAAFVNKPTQAAASNPSTTLVSGTGAVDCGATYAIDVETYVDASNNAYNLACAADTAAVGSSDTLTIRRAGSNVAPLDGNRLQICSTRSQAEIIKGSACTGEIHDLNVNAYYVDEESDGNANIPSLRRKFLISTAAGPDFQDGEIIPGIEDMQVQLGWDSTGTSGTAVEYVNPGSAVLATGQVVAIRVWLLIRADTVDKEYQDTRTYEYGDRAIANGTTNDLSAAGAAAKAYAPGDNYRRLLVSRTFFIRNAIGT